MSTSPNEAEKECPACGKPLMEVSNRDFTHYCRRCSRYFIIPLIIAPAIQERVEALASKLAEMEALREACLVEQRRNERCIGVLTTDLQSAQEQNEQFRAELQSAKEELKQLSFHDSDVIASLTSKLAEMGGLVESAFREGFRFGWSHGGSEISSYERGSGLTSDREKKRLQDDDWSDSNARQELEKMRGEG